MRYTYGRRMLRGRAEMQMVEPSSRSEAVSANRLAPEQLFRAYSAYVAAVAHRLLGDDLDVDDTVQEVFLIALRGAASIRDVGAVKGWLASVTVRVARRRLRTRRVKSLLGLADAPTYEGVADNAATPEQRALLMQVYGALEKVPVNARIAWVLRHIEGERLDEVAVLSGCSLATAKRRIAEAERLLREALGDG